jgi:hypothetical protein
MERNLRSAFCSLVGSKYAAVVCAGQSVNWLIEQCRALVSVNLELTSEHQDAIRAALAACAAADKRRNVLVHGEKTASRVSDGSLMTIRSRLRTIDPQIESWTPATIREAAGEQVTAGLQLFGAMQSAVSPRVMVLDNALAWEIRRHEEAGTPTRKL